MLGSNQRPLPCEGSALPRAPVNTMRPGRRIRNLVSLPCTALLFLKLLPTLTAGHHFGLTECGSAAHSVLYFETCVERVAAERTDLPVVPLRPSDSVAVVSSTCPSWASWRKVHGVFSILASVSQPFGFCSSVGRWR